MKFKEKLNRFMYGRYGFDELSFALLLISVVLSLVRLFIRNTALNLSLYALDVLLFALIIYRMFSRNIYKRKSENAKFKKIVGKPASVIKLNINRIKYRKTHVYRKCPHCKNVLRLPKVKGKHHAACPVCGNSFEVNI